MGFLAGDSTDNGIGVGGDMGSAGGVGGVGCGVSGGAMSRRECAALLMRYLKPLKPHYSAGGARLRLGAAGATYADDAAQFEAWARPLWGLGPFWAGGGHDAWFEETYRRGLVHGTDPSHPEYWGVPGNHDQRSVEMPAVAYALMLAPQVLWEPLRPQEREQVARWLLSANEAPCPNNNWLLFPVVVNVALKRLGMPFSRELIVRNLDRVDAWYASGGWYRDGAGDQRGSFDYYNAWAFQVYGPLVALYAADVVGADRARTLLERARTFAPGFVRLFADRGESVPFGRSLTYRFAQCAFFSFAAAHGLDLGEDVSRGVMKGIVARNLRFWAGMPTCDNGGVLTVGYHYPTLFASETYNAPGSPLWGMKAFAVLGLPEDDPFWRLPDEPLPAALCADGVHSLTPDAGMIVQRRDGEATLYANGPQPAAASPEYEPKYMKFCYSTRYGFSMPRSERSLEAAAPDSALAFVVGGHVLCRGNVRAEDCSWDGVTMTCRWSPCAGIAVTTRITPTEHGHRREHEVRAAFSCEAYDCGFAVPSARGVGESDAQWRVRIDAMCTVIGTADGAADGADGAAGNAVSGGAVSSGAGAVGDGVGADDVRAAGAAAVRPVERLLIRADPNLNLMASRVVIPAVRYAVAPGLNRFTTTVTEGPIATQD